MTKLILNLNIYFGTIHWFLPKTQNQKLPLAYLNTKHFSLLLQTQFICNDYP